MAVSSIFSLMTRSFLLPSKRSLYSVSSEQSTKRPTLLKLLFHFLQHSSFRQCEKSGREELTFITLLYEFCQIFSCSDTAECELDNGGYFVRLVLDKKVHLEGTFILAIFSNKHLPLQWLTISRCYSQATTIQTYFSSFGTAVPVFGLYF